MGTMGTAASFFIHQLSLFAQILTTVRIHWKNNSNKDNKLLILCTRISANIHFKAANKKEQQTNILPEPSPTETSDCCLPKYVLYVMTMTAFAIKQNTE